MLGFRNITAGKLRSLGDRQSRIPPRRKSTSNVSHSSETLKMVAWGKSAQITEIQEPIFGGRIRIDDGGDHAYNRAEFSCCHD
jgi:hypothetical protein